MRKRSLHPLAKLGLIAAALLVAGYIFLFYVFGFLVNLAFSVRDRATPASRSSVEKEGPLVMIDPVLEDVPYATNTATIQVHGNAMPESMVNLYVNSTKVDARRSNFDGEVTFEVALAAGDNELYITSNDTDTKKKLTSRVYSVLYADTPPNLTLEGIEEGKTVSSEELIVQGHTDKEVFIQINNAPVVVRADGSFSLPVRLKEGNNMITIVATDIAGNEAKKEITVVYKK